MRDHPNALNEYDPPEANDKSVLDHTVYGELFKEKVPNAVKGFECHDAEKMAELYPAGTEAAHEVGGRPPSFREIC